MNLEHNSEAYITFWNIIQIKVFYSMKLAIFNLKDDRSLV